MSAIKFPFITEKAMTHMEDNKLQFVVDTRANKSQIKEDVIKIYGFPVKSVCTTTTMKGEKKALVTFDEVDAAHEIATRIGLM
ncbi:MULTISPECIES: 50S ribosomal protein L23 [Methanohalophilus]|jgi:large subunit ribosomal protein L23|uniref:Large ribosomal subunit protein uL23 n=4 Tax=Methanohalophilus TaxID=2175 RepID=D5E6S5_METMS|nr:MULTISPECIES: 50S ribosomal protein L23 [Methanohalophilus]ADE36863.1 LSU ribosomal protein L23P [Methanohalophilus mahii DSM 5219]APH39230.1 50S ribosomal protein L23 [Methanohalophilus halophilus]ATU07854.1 50S ribosomal protein L23 [Methanohalophilus portucalensis]OJH49320.1 50S ribosomal protein L23P [Methanohalophilus portucalensis FDF-1]RNI09708.1 50S ribosomal protein L23 [Methanohalophilus halophilus]